MFIVFRRKAIPYFGEGHESRGQSALTHTTDQCLGFHYLPPGLFTSFGLDTLARTSSCFCYAKSLLNPHLLYLSTSPPTMKPSVLHLKLSKTVYFTLWAVFSGGFATVTAIATVTVVLNFFFFIYFW